MGRKLTPRTGVITPYTFYGFDVETRGKTNDFIMVTIWGEDFKRTFDDPVECIRAMRELSGRYVRFVATNLQFDLMALTRDTRYREKLVPIVRGGKFIGGSIMTVYSGKRKNIKFMESTCFFQMGVKSLGEKIVGIKKLDPPSYIGKRGPETQEEWDYMDRYCMRDSEITCRTMIFAQNLYNDLFNSKMGLTNASSSFDDWCRNYLDRDIWQLPKHFIELIYEGYYGGRTETFRRGTVKSDDKKKYKCYDINSLYPYVMREYEYPDPNTGKFLYNGHVEYIERFEGMSEVDIESPKNIHKPFLPYRHKSGKLLFPLGRWSGVYSHVELRHAMSLGYIIHEVRRTGFFKGKWRPFKEFVDKKYAMRLKFQKEGKKAEEKFMKIDMNSLYGRFALRVLGSRKIFHIDELDEKKIDSLMDEGYECEVHEDWYYFTLKEIKEYPPHVIPILSAYVTSYARMELYDLMKDDDELLYVDTDSIFTTKEHKTSDELGALKKEYDIDAAVFVRPKFYSVVMDELDKDGNKKSFVKVKGSRIYKIDDFMRFINEPDQKKRIVTRRRFASFLTCNRKYKGKIYKWNEHMHIQRSLNLDDTKRAWTDDKFDPNNLQESRPWAMIDGIPEFEFNKEFARASKDMPKGRYSFTLRWGDRPAKIITSQ